MSSADPRLLTELRVIDLKAELGSRNLDVSGLKVDLVARLKEAMEAEGKDPETFRFQVETGGTPKKFVLAAPDISDELDNDVEDIPIEEELSILSDEASGNEKENWDGADEGKLGSEAAGKEEIPGPDDVEPRHLFTTEDTIQLHLAAHSGTDSASVIAQRGDESSTMSDTGETGQNAAGLNGDIQSLGDLVAETAAVVANEQTRQSSESNSKRPQTSEEEKSDCNGAVGVKRFVRTASNGEGADVNNKSEAATQPASKGPPASSGKNLWISGLSSNTRATDLKAAFSKYGRVLAAKIVTSAKQPGSKCYGFVSMSSPEEASKCIQNLHRTELHGKMISVERSKNDNVIPSKKPIDSSGDKGKDNQAKAEGEDKVELKGGAKSEAVAESKKEGINETKKEDSTKRDKSVDKKDDRRRSKSRSRDRSSRKRSRDRESSHHRSSSRGDRPRITAPTRGATGFYRGYRAGHHGVRSTYPSRAPPGTFVPHRYERPVEDDLGRRPGPVGYRGRGGYAPAPYGGRDDPALLRVAEERERERIAYELRIRQRDIELAQKEESMRLLREREKIRFERERLEREKIEVEHLKQIQQQSFRTKRVIEPSSYPDSKRPAYVSSSYSRDRPTVMPPRYPEGPPRENFNRDLDRRGPAGPPQPDRYSSRVAPVVDRSVRLPESPRGVTERPRLPPPRDDRRREEDRRGGRSPPPSARDHRRPPSPPRVPPRRDFPPAIPPSVPPTRANWQDDRDRRPLRDERDGGNYPSRSSGGTFAPIRRGGPSGTWTGHTGGPPSGQSWNGPSRDTSSWQPRGGGSSSRGDSGYGSYPTSDRYASTSARRF